MSTWGRTLKAHAGAWRTAMALAVLLAFWAALVRAFWPELAPALFRLVQSARGIGSERVDSAYLEVRNNSSAQDALVRRIVAQLETDYEAVRPYLGRETEHRIPVLIANGPGPALTDGGQLLVYYDDGDVDLSTTPFLLVLLSEGDLSVPGLHLFVEGGFAVYVAEEIGRARPLLGQSSDAWVALLKERGQLLPLTKAWAADMPGNEREMQAAVRTVLEAGSFMRWVTETSGIEAAHGLRDGLSLEEATGLSFAQAERAWLDAVASRELDPLPCDQALPAHSLLRGFCDLLDAGTPVP